MHVNRDSSQGYSKNRLHCGVSISEPDDLDECIIYNVAHVDKKWAVAFLRGLLENNQVPDISGWNILADRHTHFDVENLTTIIRILTEHLPQQNRDAARENLNAFLSHPRRYFKKNAQRYDERGIEHFDDEDESTIAAATIADELIANGAMREFEYDCDPEDFIYEISQAADAYGLEVQFSWINPEYTVAEWCDAIDQRWKDSGYCLGAMDIESSSFVTFIATKEQLRELGDLGDLVSIVFGNTADF